jgi:hypothetical protein
MFLANGFRVLGGLALVAAAAAPATVSAQTFRGDVDRRYDDRRDYDRFDDRRDDGRRDDRFDGRDDRRDDWRDDNRHDDGRSDREWRRLDDRYTSATTRRFDPAPRPVLRPAPVLSTLPSGASPLRVGQSTYYRHENRFYEPVRQSNSLVYSQVAPPYGHVVTTLPNGCVSSPWRGQNYYLGDGVCYRQNGRGYEVCEPPLGLEFTTLPIGATPVTVDGRTHYKSRDVYFLPRTSNGRTVYAVERHLR